MKTGIIVWSLTGLIPGLLTLAGLPGWIPTQDGAARPKLIAVASHTVHSPDEAGKVAPTMLVARKAVAEKPAPARTSVRTESAADRILRRLDEAFPYRNAGAARPAETRGPGIRQTGAQHAARASHPATLTSRISLRWPEEIAPRAIK